MRELIDVNFEDKTSYSSQVGADVGAIVFDAPWGPTDKIERVGLSEFLSKFPIPEYMDIPLSYLNAYRAFLSGMPTIEAVRFGAGSAYITIDIAAVAPAIAIAESISGETTTLALKYKGAPSFLFDPLWTYTIKTEVVAATDFERAGVKVTLSGEDSEANVKIIEEVEGCSFYGEMIDGQRTDISHKLNKSQYFTGEGITADITLVPAAEELTSANLIAAWAPSAVADVVAVYPTHFSSIENSAASILIDPNCDTPATASIIAAVANTRSDAVAILGLPVTIVIDPTDTSAIETFHSGLTPTMMAAFYVTRELVTLKGRTYVLNGAGTIAGRTAAVANTQSVNQLPSARSWGAFGGVLETTLDFTNVLRLHGLGINSVYSTTQGPRIFGLRSLFPRESSYYSRFNVPRVIARILKYAFGIASDAIHTGNTANRKALTQNLLNADLNKLKGQGALKVASIVICDASNNQDADTNGGKYLNVDYICYFVSLIERVRFSITATDSSVTVKLS